MAVRQAAGKAEAARVTVTHAPAPRRDFRVAVCVEPAPETEASVLPTIGVENKHVLNAVDRLASNPAVHRFVWAKLRRVECGNNCACDIHPNK